MNWKYIKTPYNAIDVKIDSQLAGGKWEAFYMSDLHWPRAMLMVGIHRWHQLLWEFEGKKNLLETDPGPLDAKVS